MQQAPSAITLTTDFGTADPFVGILKGVIIRIHPGATIVDLTHEIPPQDVVSAAYHLDNAWRHFPTGTVHLAVVDPGVGSSRRAVAVDAAGHFFVAPDNGLLTPILDEPDRRAFEITAPDYMARSPSPTFHGRDIFAPAAAWLARGTPIERLGSELTQLVRIDREPARIEGSKIHARVLHIDRFGNVILNVEGVHLAGATIRGHEAGLQSVIGGHKIDTFVTHYSAAGGKICFLINSDGRLEIAFPNGSAAARLGISRGARVLLEIL